MLKKKKKNKNLCFKSFLEEDKEMWAGLLSKESINLFYLSLSFKMF